LLPQGEQARLIKEAMEWKRGQQLPEVSTTEKVIPIENLFYKPFQGFLLGDVGLCVWSGEWMPHREKVLAWHCEYRGAAGGCDARPVSGDDEDRLRRRWVEMGNEECPGNYAMNISTNHCEFAKEYQVI